MAGNIDEKNGRVHRLPRLKKAMASQRRTMALKTWWSFFYNPHALAGTTKIENGIMPPPPRRAMVPDRNCRQLDCPVPIAHRGGGSAEVALEAAFSYKNIHGRKTCHNEKRKSFNSSMLVRLSYKKV